MSRFNNPLVAAGLTAYAIERQNGWERRQREGTSTWAEQRRFWIDAILQGMAKLEGEEPDPKLMERFDHELGQARGSAATVPAPVKLQKETIRNLRCFVSALRDTGDDRRRQIDVVWKLLDDRQPPIHHKQLPHIESYDVRARNSRRCLMPYIHFTEEQKNQANRVDLAEFLRFKGEPLIRSGRELRMERNQSVTIRGNEWYDHATEKGGGPVSFLKEFYGMNYQQAVLTLLDEDISQLCPQVDTPREKAKKEFALPPANENNRRAFAYLLKHRHLDRDVLTTFVRMGLVYEDKGYHNAVFVGMDINGEAHHAHKRSTNSQGKAFRMTVEGSDFRYAFNWPGSSGHLLVFEAPIDMLSFISMHHDSNWAKHSYVALCGTSSQPMLGMLERYPQIQTVHLCLDNDQAGQLATKRLAKLLREKGLAVDARVPVLKDWNEDLCSHFQQKQEMQHEQNVS